MVEKRRQTKQQQETLKNTNYNTESYDFVGAQWIERIQTMLHSTLRTYANASVNDIILYIYTDSST